MTTHTTTAQRSSKHPTTIGIDVGGTGMKGGLVRLGSGPKSGTLRGDRFRIPTPQPAMAEPVAATLAAGDPGAGARLARSIRAEAAVALLVLWAVAELTSVSPPAAPHAMG